MTRDVLPPGAGVNRSAPAASEARGKMNRRSTAKKRFKCRRAL